MESTVSGANWGMKEGEKRIKDAQTSDLGD